MEFLEPTQPMDDWMIDEKDIKLSEKDKLLPNLEIAKLFKSY